MSVSNFQLNAHPKQLKSFFIDIFNHLRESNYRNGVWTTAPNITNLTGSPTYTHHFQRFGQILYFTVVVNGTSQTSSSKIDNLPYTATEYGIVSVYNTSDESDIGKGYVDKDTTDVYLPDWNVTSKNITIQGFVRISGI